jgi:hypothetical protein
MTAGPGNVGMGENCAKAGDDAASVKRETTTRKARIRHPPEAISFSTSAEHCAAPTGDRYRPIVARRELARQGPDLTPSGANHALPSLSRFADSILRQGRAERSPAANPWRRSKYMRRKCASPPNSHQAHAI